MEVKAITKSVRIVPQKTRLVINLIRGKSVLDAVAILENQPQKAASIINKTLKSAIANATNNFGLKEEDLYVKSCMVDEGRVLKRYRMLSKGRVGHNDHKLSHITIIVSVKDK
ncbi:MAG: 50S ribosomal protein L22 [bacterium]|nr:50S ribosomal protein L22 [bacterium]